MDKITFLNELELELDELPRKEKINSWMIMKIISMNKNRKGNQKRYYIGFKRTT